MPKKKQVSDTPFAWVKEIAYQNYPNLDSMPPGLRRAVQTAEYYEKHKELAPGVVVENRNRGQIKLDVERGNLALFVNEPGTIRHSLVCSGWDFRDLIDAFWEDADLALNNDEPVNESVEKNALEVVKCVQEIYRFAGGKVGERPITITTR
ncbi:MAG: hypothetical protein ACREQW_17070, partial [Candidatus Binatia bacterium]